MAGVPALGTVVATQDGPTALEFEFVVSEESARQYIESGSFVQTKQADELVLGMVQRLRRVNRYYSSPDIIHGSSNGVSLPSVYPADKWDYVIASVKVLGSYRNDLQTRSTRPVLPGSLVEFAENEMLQKFLGLTKQGLQIGKVRQSELDAIVNLDKLLQKHLAILSISGGGKSYATSVIIEELMKRKKSEGRPALVIFDVHGEYKQLTSMPKHSEFSSAQVERISADRLSLAMGYLSSSDLRKFFPTMSYAQSRELDSVMRKLRIEGEPITAQKVVKKIFATEMNQLVKDALLGWINMLNSTQLFGNVENPNLESSLAPGKLLIIDLSSITTLWVKQILVHYFLSRIFALRRAKDIPPVISIIEEAHQFAPESVNAASKSIIHTIAREGRKFLCSMILISQRPVNLSTTALSQCNTHLILRILNPHDLAWIGKSSEGINQETLGMITTLGVGEGLLVGEAVKYPIFVQIRKKLMIAEFDDTSLARESIIYEKMKVKQ